MNSSSYRSPLHNRDDFFTGVKGSKTGALGLKKNSEVDQLQVGIVVCENGVGLNRTRKSFKAWIRDIGT
jgi:hypothetical protein